MRGRQCSSARRSPAYRALDFLKIEAVLSETAGDQGRAEARDRRGRQRRRAAAKRAGRSGLKGRLSFRQIVSETGHWISR